MSIASAIQTKQQQVANAYTAISNKGGTLPATQDLANMPSAINSISTTNLTTLNITQNGTYTPQSPYNGFSSVTANITSGLLESIMQNVVDGNNPVDVTTLQAVETQLHALL